jgi:hypothetical protein
MRFLSTLILSLLYIYCNAQKAFVFPKIKPTISTLSQIAPTNWTAIKSVYGDLNGDGLEDYATILEYNTKIEEHRTYGDNHSDIIKEIQKPRILAIYFKNTINDTYQLSTQNNDFILRGEEGGKLGDPLLGINIKDKKLFLRFQGGSEWRWELGYTFKFQNNDWFLTNAINLYYNSKTGSMTERNYNFIDRELINTYGNIYQRNISNFSNSEVLYFNQLRTFKTFKKPWAWEILPNTYL